MKLFLFAVLGAMLLSIPAHAADSVDWSNLTLDQLKNIKVTSVSKKSEQAFDAAAAIFVITKEDIRRSGATSIPEALRLAPGVQVARAGSNQWAISIRGFNDQFSNKLLVLIDGRSVYTPLFSGVYWDVQDTLLEDVKQIEVIRGPGATLWGANAVNGVINIITEESSKTTGKFVSTTIGNQENGASTRVGGQIGNDAYYRVYAKYGNNDEQKTLTHEGAQDDSNSVRSGFRVDWDRNLIDTVTLQGDIYRNMQNHLLTIPTLSSPFSANVKDSALITGGNVLSRWKHAYEGGGASTVQVYFDNAARNEYFAEQNVNTFDFDLQHSLAPTHRNEITVGAGYRLVDDSIEGTDLIYFTPDSKRTNLYSAFIQDKIHLIESKLFLTLGAKYEYNAYTHGETQPSARLSYLPSENQTLWTSVSRAVRIPIRTMSDAVFNVAGTPGGYYKLQGDLISGLRIAQSEELIAYEAGYRVEPIKTLSFDATVFYNDYDKLVSNYQVNSLTITPANDSSGESHGFEISSKWQKSEKWDLSASYTLLRTYLKGTSTAIPSGQSPNDQYSISSHYRFSDSIEMTNTIYTVGSLPSSSVSDYTRFDTVLNWKPVKQAEFSLVGQNLFNGSQQEFKSFFYSQPERVGRVFYANAKFRF